ncbi:MAG: hypothetical protein ACRD9R_20705 [Pyrinomonadaceae bacterium]
MGYWKMRLLALAMIVVGGGLTYHNWQQLLEEGRYSFRLATFGPVAIVLGLFVLLFPARAGAPTTMPERLVALAALGVGLIAGLFNLYLMDPYFFGQ